MQTFPRRLVPVTLVLALAAGIGWWFMQARSGKSELPQVQEQALPDSANDAVEAPSFFEFTAALPAGPCASATRQVIEAHADRLRQQQDPTAQLAYALTAPFEELPDPVKVGRAEYQRAYTRVALDQQARVNSALLQAFALAPEDAEVRWLAAVYCMADEACAAPRKALMAAESDNITVWLRELTWARTRNDIAGGEHAFARAASAPRFETHLGVEQEVLLAAYGDLPMPGVCKTPEGQSELRTASQRGNGEDVTMLDVVLIRGHSMKFLSQPVMFDLRERCKPDAFVNADDVHRDRCRKILSQLAMKGSMLERIVSLESLAAAMAGEPDAARWRERLREIHWMQQVGGHPSVQSLLRPEDYMFNEVEGLQAALEAAELWPPPADWMPGDERSRSIVPSGRPRDGKKRQ